MRVRCRGEWGELLVLSGSVDQEGSRCGRAGLERVDVFGDDGGVLDGLQGMGMLRRSGQRSEREQCLRDVFLVVV